MMFRVIQRMQNKAVTVWCTTDKMGFLCSFCQYMLDNAIPEGLKDFWIVQTDDKETVVKQVWFPIFCREQRIRKRTFQERMG